MADDRVSVGINLEQAQIGSLAHPSPTDLAVLLKARYRVFETASEVWLFAPAAGPDIDHRWSSGSLTKFSSHLLQSEHIATAPLAFRFQGFLNQILKELKPALRLHPLIGDRLDDDVGLTRRSRRKRCTDHLAPVLADAKRHPEQHLDDRLDRLSLLCGVARRLAPAHRRDRLARRTSARSA